MDENTLQVVRDAFPQLLEKFVTMTIPLTVISFALALVIAVVTAMIQYARVRGLQRACRVYIWIIRCTPLLVQLYLVYYGLPNAGILLDKFVTVVLVFSFNEGAYMAETMRAAMEAVPTGQMEAGYCVGMSYLQIMWRIVLPQAFRTAFPPLSNSLISLVKDTSLANIIAVSELFRAAKNEASRTASVEPLFVAGLFYLAMNGVVTLVFSYLTKRFDYYKD